MTDALFRHALIDSTTSTFTFVLLGVQPFISAFQFSVAKIQANHYRTSNAKTYWGVKAEELRP